eukprot:m.180968 g.180968  ORF g.180968 m.180968 type:complete len:67 (-) comp18025_c0_seq3:166-366(-)
MVCRQPTTHSLNLVTAHLTTRDRSRQCKARTSHTATVTNTTPSTNPSHSRTDTSECRHRASKGETT